jgi:hypothetical protein
LDLKDAKRLAEGRLPVMVVSHERSGTHFTMNTVAACFDYISDPWIDFDRHQFNINYYHPQSVTSLLLELGGWKTADILKSHHEYAFFQEVMAALQNVFHVVYVYRNPADVMVSFWRFLHTWYWTEGPKTDTALTFAKTAPMGRLMRFQMRQYDTMLDRWANHVEHWLRASTLSRNIHVVKYEDLVDHYEAVVKGLGDAMGLVPSRIVRPSRHESVIQAGDIKFEAMPGPDKADEIFDLAMTKFPGLMARLGYKQGVRKIAI